MPRPDPTRGHAALRQEGQDQLADRAHRLLGLLHPGRDGRGRRSTARRGKSQVVCDGGQLYKVSKSKAGVVSRDRLTTTWTDWVDYWAVDFDYGSRREIVKRPKQQHPSFALQGNLVAPSQGELVEWEDWWTGGYIFENEWQSFRTRQDRKLELTSAPHVHARPGRYQVAVKVIDIFGNDTMTLVPVNVG